MTEANYFATQLKNHRARLKLSMQALADLASISKSMICKIERNETQPTIDVAARIANALGMSLTELIQPPEKVMALLIPVDQQPIENAHDNVQCRTLSPTRHGHTVKWSLVTLGLAASFKNPPHNILNKNYYLFLKSGKLEVQVDQETFQVNTNDSFYFRPKMSFKMQNLSESEEAVYAVVEHSSEAAIAHVTGLCV